ncbi:hypothetical protein [Candidatus Rhabdochlamydia porcellionis]|jgi:hypothetical protein|uniref:ABC transmembrane type-1 domain-containing protein n=1 Tax=Candidatus Rhabdochlamydia porcellionis TaxID=225148 RepID=A0ABX8Z146_9BACT|nr:hypothetical protein [Candidatus Rhabdochlamydia porcellionis]QZA59158.1 hypothetical protein RHAB15C_0001043 [Candidatus Rhabdochlamydia porcellionis]
MHRITSEYRLEVYAQLEEHIEGIQHFDVLQCILRKMSITLLMGTFAAIGFLLSINPPILPFSSIAISIFICVFSFLMNTIISAIDLIFIERLLMSAFIDALRLEKENPWFFPIHFHMINSSREHHGRLQKKLQFYIGYSKDLLFLLFVCISFLLGVDNWRWIMFLLTPITILCIWGYGKLLKTLAVKSEKRLYRNFEKELGKLDHG